MRETIAFWGVKMCPRAYVGVWVMAICLSACSGDYEHSAKFRELTSCMLGALRTVPEVTDAYIEYSTSKDKYKKTACHNPWLVYFYSGGSSPGRRRWEARPYHDVNGHLNFEFMAYQGGLGGNSQDRSGNEKILKIWKSRCQARVNIEFL